ncbi:MAG: hypothetical protein U0797_09100 [Gemmataceae bacterium]
MRMLLLLAWLLLPVGFAIWHFGPGQEHQRIDQAGDLLAKADEAARAERWADAVALYDEALKYLPEGKAVEGRKVRLEKAKAQMMAAGLNEAQDDLKTLVDELQSDAGADQKLLAEARSALAQSHYYMTWLMRLEGMPRDVWEPEIEASRQAYRLLAEQAKAAGDEAATARYTEDVEASVRLARMELAELQGLPLPSQ